MNHTAPPNPFQSTVVPSGTAQRWPDWQRLHTQLLRERHFSIRLRSAADRLHDPPPHRAAGISRPYKSPAQLSVPLQSPGPEQAAPPTPVFSPPPQHPPSLRRQPLSQRLRDAEAFALGQLPREETDAALRAWEERIHIHSSVATLRAAQQGEAGRLRAAECVAIVRTFHEWYDTAACQVRHRQWKERAHLLRRKEHPDHPPPPVRGNTTQRLILALRQPSVPPTTPTRSPSPQSSKAPREPSASASASDHDATQPPCLSGLELTLQRIQQQFESDVDSQSNDGRRASSPVGPEAEGESPEEEKQQQTDSEEEEEEDGFTKDWG
eukprot:GGOE01020783.1.p1 GENE.GGOE01020783.1~~GGOE01020783.1.p1  ORF type:complete len:324 (-),score=65.22 GGOE01020783.1:262-1233(-)